MMSSSGGFARTLLAILLMVAIPACKSELATAPASPASPDNSPAAPTGDPLFISGEMTPLHQRIRVSDFISDVTDAEVTVNGTRIPHCCGNIYAGDLPEAVPAGGKLTLKVAAPGYQTFEATGIVTGIPAITAPASGTASASTDAIRLQWTIPTDPDRFEVCLNCIDNSNDGAIYPALGRARELVIQPFSLVDYGEGTPVAVYARKDRFLKSAGSNGSISDVLFTARSRAVLIFIKN